MGLFDFLKKKNNRPEISNNSEVEVADQLENLGYFKYADIAYLQELKSEIGKGLAIDHYLPFC